jgi:hypothetical protein
MIKRRLLFIPALLALAFGTAALGQGAATAQAPVDGEPDLAYTAPAGGLAACNGGAQEASLVRLNDVPVTIGETPNPVLVPGAVIPFQTPANDTDQILVRFDAEARLEGQPNTFVTPADFLQVVVLLDGVPMSPDNDQMFTTDIGQSDATSDCKRVGPGNHVVTVFWQLVDQAAADVLTGTLDDWLLEVRISG